MAVTLCPVAVVAGCRKCPIFNICPLKSVIGDQPGAEARSEAEKPASKARSRKSKAK